MSLIQKLISYFSKKSEKTQIDDKKDTNENEISVIDCTITKIKVKKK